MMTQKLANLILVTVAMGWGSTIIFTKLSVDAFSPFTYVALRFGIAFIIMTAILYKKIIHVDVKTLKYSAILGALLFGSLIAFCYGIKNTSATSTGFLMSTTVILVPILQAFITRKLPSNKILFGVTIVSIGLALLTISGDFTFASGSLYCLVSAFLYGVQIITTSRFTREIDALKLGVYQLGFAALYATIGTFVIETPVLPHEAIDRISILSLALITAYGFVMQSIAQKYTTPESTGFLFSFEPIFSAIFAFIFLHENMGNQGYFGALLILVGVFIANSTSKKQPLIKEVKAHI